MDRNDVRILIVDDMQEGRYLLETLLKGVGYSVVSTRNGAEALEKLRTEDFEIIITDILMPVMDGFQLCMNVKQDTRLRNIPLVFYSATYVDELDEDLAMMMGAARFIRKPEEPEEFTRIIDEVLTEFREGRIRPRRPHLESQGILLQRYNERIVNKLQEKMQDLENEIARRKKVEDELRHAQHLLRIRDQIAGIFLTFPDERVYGAVLDVILDAVQSEYGIFGYIDDDGQYVCPSLTRNVWDQCQVSGKDIVFPRETWAGIWSKALIEKTTVCSNTPLAVPEGHVPITRAISAPIVYHDETIGNIVVGNKPADYEEKDRALLETLAGYIAPVLHSRLVRERKERERRRAEEALKESEERYRIVADFTQDWDYWMGTDKRILYMSPSCEGVTGYSSKEFIDNPQLLHRMVHPDDTDAFSNHIAELDKDPMFATTSFDFRIIRKDGNERWINHACRGVLGAGGEPRGRRVSNRDITDRKRVEDSLRESEGRYRLLIEESPVGIGIVQNERHTYVNPAFMEVFGYESASEILNRSPEDLIAPEDRRLTLAKREDLLFGKPVPYHQEVKGLRKNGEVFDLAIWPRRIDYSGRPAILTFVADRSEAKTLRAQLFQAQKMEAIGALAGGIAHDFNNLLQVILGYSDLLLTDAPEGSRFGNALREIGHAGRSGAELIRGLLTFSRKAEAHLRPINLNQCVEHVNKLLLRTLFKTIKVEMLLDANLVTINADPTQMEQVLMNLAVNARDAMPEGGKITIETRNITVDEDYCRLHLDVRPGQCVMLTVSDTGHGMDRPTLDRIFEPFFSTKGPGKGTGLGLSIVYGIVKQHGGHIECYSQPRDGTTFRIYLPVIATISGADTVTERSVIRGGTETILVVDDDERILKFCKECLGRSGYRVLVASSGREALELYRRKEGPISLVILDLIMPEMSGKQCLDELHTIDPRVKVIISTGYLEEEPTKGAYELSTRGFLKKPYDMTQILKMVREVLDEP